MMHANSGLQEPLVDDAAPISHREETPPQTVPIHLKHHRPMRSVVPYSAALGPPLAVVDLIHPRVPPQPVDHIGEVAAALPCPLHALVHVLVPVQHQRSTPLGKGKPHPIRLLIV